VTPETRTDLERRILAGIIQEPSKLTPILGVLKPEHFGNQRHRVWFETILELQDRADPISVTSLVCELEKTRRDQSSALKAELELLMFDGHLEMAYVGYHVRELLAEIRRRKIAVLSSQIAAGERLDDELLAELRDEIAPKDVRRETLGELAGSLAQRSIAGLSLDEGSLLTPWPELNNSILGLAPGTLTLVAARPGRGKTVFVTDIARHVAANGHPVLFFSLEMSREGITTRLLAALSSVDHTVIRRGWIGNDNGEALTDAAERIGSMPFEVNDRGGLSIQQMRALAAAHKEHGGLALIVVDYAQLASDPKSERRIDEMAAVSRGLKEMAKELRVPVLSAVQLNRQGDSEKPRLSQIRECGQFEQDADTILFLWMQENQEQQATPEIEVWIAKNRQGPGTQVRLQFQKNRCRMVSLAPEAVFA
jgi:replicative DNA helicase